MYHNLNRSGSLLGTNAAHRAGMLCGRTVCAAVCEQVLASKWSSITAPDTAHCNSLHTVQLDQCRGSTSMDADDTLSDFL